MIEKALNLVNNSFSKEQLSTLFNGPHLKSFIEVAFVCLFIYGVYRAYIKGTQAERLIKGIVIILIMLLVSKLLILMDLQIVGKFFETIVNIVLFGLVVVFQPELRRFLGYLGQPGFLSKNLFNSHETKTQLNIIDELTDAVKYLSKSHTGALMVLQDHTENSGYLEVGTRINGLLSTELLLTIFHTNTALHDGAVIINGGHILSAGVLLPLTEDPKLSWQYGTRHRAAIGMSEISDCLCVVVSEETGNISVAQSGKLTKCEDLQHFKAIIQDYLGIEETEEKPKEKYLNMFKFFKNDKKTDKDDDKSLSKSQAD